MREIDIAELAAALEAGAVVVDVREPAEYAEGHVPGAVNASYTRLPLYLGRIPRGRRLLVHCASGVRSAAASAFLAREGFDVTYVGDAFNAYRAAHEVETGAPAESTADAEAGAA